LVSTTISSPSASSTGNSMIPATSESWSP
jgi:hypothetical protein